jgi:hypothetical protein
VVEASEVMARASSEPGNTAADERG